MSELKKIWEVQQLEIKKTDLEKQLKHLPAAKELKKLKAEIEAGQEQLKKKKEDYDRDKKRLKHKEDEASAQREKIEELSKDLYDGYSGSNAKELAGAAAKLDDLKRKLGHMDDEIISQMEKAENRKQDILTDMDELNIKKDSFRQLNREYQAQKDEISAELEKIPGQKDALTKEVDPEKLALYQKLAPDFPDGVVIAEAKNGICAGCRMGVSFDVMKHLKADGRIIYCDNCGRILMPAD